MGLKATAGAEPSVGTFRVASAAVNVTSESGLIAQLLFGIALTLAHLNFKV